MENRVFSVINELLEIKALRLEERGLLSQLSEDEVINLIDALVEALKSDYLKQ